MLLLLFLLPFHVQCIAYKMVTVYGAPDSWSSHPISVKSGVPWSECVQGCLTDSDCLLVYGNSSSICVNYNYGDARKIRNDKNASVSNEMVSFKIETEAECAAEPAGMLHGSITNTAPYYNMNASTITVAEEYYTIAYTTRYAECSFQYGPVINCEGCKRRLIVFRGHVNAGMTHFGGGLARSWYNCMLNCLVKNWCFLAAMPSPKDCRFYKLSDSDSFTQSLDYNIQEASAENGYLALKFAPIDSGTSCPPTLGELFTGRQESYFGYHTTEFSSYSMLTNNQFETTFTWTPFSFDACQNKDLFTLTNVHGCYGMFYETTTYPKAVEKCHSLGGDDLITVFSRDAAEAFRDAYDATATEDGYLFVGYTRATQDSPWQWTLPLPTFDNVIPKASVELLNGNGTYAALSFMPGTDVLLHPRNGSTSEMGFICHFMSSNKF